jgi:hypothetical protein
MGKNPVLKRWAIVRSTDARRNTNSVPWSLILCGTLSHPCHQRPPRRSPSGRRRVIRGQTSVAAVLLWVICGSCLLALHFHLYASGEPSKCRKMRRVARLPGQKKGIRKGGANDSNWDDRAHQPRRGRIWQSSRPTGEPHRRFVRPRLVKRRGSAGFVNDET